MPPKTDCHLLTDFFLGPPGMLPPQMPGMDNKPPNSATESSLQSLSESLMSITQPFGLIPQPPAPHDDNMDVEMEDAEKGIEKSIPLSEQLQQMAGQYNRPNRDDRRDRRDDRERRRSRSRDRERERDRDRDRYVVCIVNFQFFKFESKKFLKSLFIN